MRINLLAPDSKIPNLALMKLSSYHKQRGDEVFLNFPLQPADYTYASLVFTWTPEPFADEIGGTKYLEKHLPPEVECQKPDYTLYPNCDFSVGFTSRGCSRNCAFCVVPQKEGKFNVVGDLYSVWNRKHDKVVFLDNNILCSQDHFLTICEQAIKENLKIDFNQGLDIRLLTLELALMLKRLKPIKQWRFAFDSLKDEDGFRRGAEHLLKAKVSKSKIMVYVLAGFDEDLEQTLKRIRVIYNEYGFDPFVMLYRNYNGKYAPEFQKIKKFGRDFGELKTILNAPTWKKFKNFARWVNHKAIFKSVKWEDYKK